jgi:hypothetical protein
MIDSHRHNELHASFCVPNQELSQFGSTPAILFLLFEEGHKPFLDPGEGGLQTLGLKNPPDLRFRLGRLHERAKELIRGHAREFGGVLATILAQDF